MYSVYSDCGSLQLNRELSLPTDSWPGTLMMDSKRLFTFIALWLFLSCVLLDHAEGFIIPRKRRRHKQRKRGPEKQLARRLKKNGCFSRSNLGMYVKNNISSNVSLIIACTQRSDVLFFFSFFWKTSPCARVRRARTRRERGAQERKYLFSSSPTPTPLRWRSINPPRFFFSSGVLDGL